METFSALLTLCAGNSPANSPHKGQWRGALMFLWSASWINGWVNNREAGDLRRHRAHYDATVMTLPLPADGPDVRPSAHTMPTERLDVFSVKFLSIMLTFIDPVTLYGPDDVIQRGYEKPAKTRRTSIWLCSPFLVDCISDQHMMATPTKTSGLSATHHRWGHYPWCHPVSVTLHQQLLDAECSWHIPSVLRQ